MIGGIQIGLLILGFYYLIMGTPPKWIQRDPTAKYVPAPGWPTRLVGAILMLPYPVSFLAGFALGIWWVAQGKNVADNSLATVAMVLDGTTLAVCILAAGIVYRLTRIPVEEFQVGGGTATDSSLITPPPDIASVTQWNAQSIGINGGLCIDRRGHRLLCVVSNNTAPRQSFIGADRGRARRHVGLHRRDRRSYWLLSGSEGPCPGTPVKGTA
jgi:hypothetical protein